MSIDIEKLKALASAATPGPWQWWTSNSTLRLTGADGKDGGVLHAYVHSGYGDISCNEANRAFVEATNPAAVRELVSEIERLRAPSSATTAGERQSIDTPEFRALFRGLIATDGEVWPQIIAHIDTWAAPLYSTRQDAARFRRAIAREDNAETLYAAVLSNAPDADAIRREFDSGAAPAPGNTAQPQDSKEE